MHTYTHTYKIKMPINFDNKYYDFEELFFEKNCDVDLIITDFFAKHKNIKADIEYITYKIKQLIEADRKHLMDINESQQNILNMIGKTSYIKHHVIPEKNDGKEYYVYCINSFI